MPSGRTFAKLLASTVLVVLLVLCWVEWRQARETLDLQFQVQRGGLVELKMWLKGELEKTNLLTRQLKRELALLGSSLGEVPVASPESHASSSLPTAIDEGIEEAPQGLEPGPSLPPKVGNPLVFLKTLEPERFYADSELHTAPRVLSRTEKLRVGCELAITRAKIDILDKEIQLVCADNLYRLRAEGAYAEYAKGQPPKSEGPGVVTFGEVTETGSSRIFAFPQEEYGEIYDKLAEKRTLAEGQIRRMMTFGTPVIPVEAAAGD